jgi:fructokinase
MKPKLILAIGEILWDMLPGERKIGGAPTNFISRLKSLNNQAYIVSKLGNDANGIEARQILQSNGLDLSYVQTDSDYPTGSVNVFFDEKRNPDYYIVPEVAYDYIEITDQLIKLSEKAECIAFGSLCQRSVQSYQTIHAMLNAGKNALRFYDINLRKNCYSKEIITRSLENADILKLNHYEAAEIGQIFELSYTSAEDICTSLIEKFSLDVCLLTLEEYGALAITGDYNIYYSAGYKVVMGDPLGAGDAFSAAFLHYYLNGREIKEALEFGNQLGAIVVTQHGAMQPISAIEFESFFSRPLKRNYHKKYSKNLQENT